MAPRSQFEKTPISVRWDRQLRSAPNQLTLLRLAAIPFIIIAILNGRWGWALALFLLAGVSDALDGLRYECARVRLLRLRHGVLQVECESVAAARPGGVDKAGIVDRHGQARAVDLAM